MSVQKHRNLGLGPGGPFGAVEECGKEETKGNREDWRLIISLQFSLGCRRQWVASPWLLLLFAGGQGGSLTSREAAAFSCVLMPVDPGTRKGPSQDIFQIHLQTVSLFYLVMPWSTQGALGLEVCFHPTGRTFLWELDWKGWEKRILLSLYVFLPIHPCQAAQQRTSWTLP